MRELAERQPELASAASLQIDLLALQRRVQRRLSTPALMMSAEEGAAKFARGQRLVEFDQIPVDWTEARLLVRQVADVLRRYDAIDAAQAEALHLAGRDQAMPAMARRWYDGGVAPAGETDAVPEPPPLFGEVIRWALGPFLQRTADIVQQYIGFEAWQRGSCPVCSGEPEMGVITPAGEGLLLCGRCRARWPFDALTCPFCGEHDRSALTSFATPDGLYRVTACTTCKRYIKALDGRHAGRGPLPALDITATLPLDAVILQKGFR